MSVHRITPLMESIPARGVAFLPNRCEATGDAEWRVEVVTVDHTILMSVEAPSIDTTLSAHLTPENARRLAADLIVAAHAAEKKER